MKVSENTLKWLMRFYPPLFFQRIWVKKIHKGFRGVDVKINKSLITTNLGSATFGGTIFAATDPFYALLFGQLMQREGFKVTVWLKSAQINYIKPARTDLHYTILITDAMIQEASNTLRNEGKFVRAYPIEILNTSGELSVTTSNEIYIRDLAFQKPKGR